VPTKAGSGYLKAVWLKVVGPVFLRLARRSTPGPPLDRRGLPGTSIYTKNKPRRPTLRPNGGERKTVYPKAVWREVLGATKWHWNWSPGLILCEFCTIF